MDLGPLSRRSIIPSQASPNPNSLNPNFTVGRNSVGIADLRYSGLIPSRACICLVFIYYNTRSRSKIFYNVTMLRFVSMFLSISIIHVRSCQRIIIKFSLMNYMIFQLFKLPAQLQVLNRHVGPTPLT
jgi:hypothetical protein